MAKRKTKSKAKKPAAKPAQLAPNLMSQVGVMRLTAALLELAGQRFADAGDAPLDLRQFLPRVEDRRDVMRAMLDFCGTPELYDPTVEYATVSDATAMLWLSAQIEERVEAILAGAM